MEATKVTSPPFVRVRPATLERYSSNHSAAFVHEALLGLPWNAKLEIRHKTHGCLYLKYDLVSACRGDARAAVVLDCLLKLPADEHGRRTVRLSDEHASELTMGLLGRDRLIKEINHLHSLGLVADFGRRRGAPGLVDTASFVVLDEEAIREAGERYVKTGHISRRVGNNATVVLQVTAADLHKDLCGLFSKRSVRAGLQRVMKEESFTQIEQGEIRIDTDAPDRSHLNRKIPPVTTGGLPPVQQKSLAAESKNFAAEQKNLAAESKSFAADRSVNRLESTGTASPNSSNLGILKENQNPNAPDGAVGQATPPDANAGTLTRERDGSTDLGTGAPTATDSGGPSPSLRSTPREVENLQVDTAAIAIDKPFRNWLIAECKKCGGVFAGLNKGQIASIGRQESWILATKHPRCVECVVEFRREVASALDDHVGAGQAARIRQRIFILASNVLSESWLAIVDARATWISNSDREEAERKERERAEKEAAKREHERSSIVCRPAADDTDADLVAKIKRMWEYRCCPTDPNRWGDSGMRHIRHSYSFEAMHPTGGPLNYWATGPSYGPLEDIAAGRDKRAALLVELNALLQSENRHQFEDALTAAAADLPNVVRRREACEAGLSQHEYKAQLQREAYERHMAAKIIPVDQRPRPGSELASPAHDVAKGGDAAMTDIPATFGYNSTSGKGKQCLPLL